MATGIGIGIAGQVFQTKAGVGIGPDADCIDSCSVNFANVSGGTQTQWLTGAQGTAMTFGAGGIGDFSVCFWMYATNLSSGANMRIFDFGLGATTPPNGRIQMHINSAGTQLIGTAKVNDTATDQSSIFTPLINTWYHITWTASRTATDLTGEWYVDGVFIGNTDVDSFPQATNVLTTATTGPFYIGRSGASGMFEGNLDDFTIWNRCLTAPEIVEIMTVSLSPTVCMNSLSFYSDLTHWWAMGDPEASVSYPTIPDVIGVQDMEMKGMSASNIDCSTSPSDQWTYIPDLNFQAALIAAPYSVTFPIPNYCLTSDINTITNLVVTGSSIADLTGIEDFALLDTLNCALNDLTSLDVSYNTNLTVLYCYSNQLTSLDVSGATALTGLHCYLNQLTSLDVSNNTSLTMFRGESNQLISLDVSNNTALWYLRCDSNQLTTLDVRNGNNTAISTANFNATNNTNLYCISVDDVVWSEANWANIDAWSSFSLGCGLYTYIPDTNFQNELIASYGVVFAGATYPDHCLTTYVSGLANVDVSNKLISDLTGIEDFADLIILECNLNTIGSLDVSSNKYLSFLGCVSNKLTSLITTGLTNLDQVFCYDNDLTSLNVSTNTALTQLSTRDNLLTTLNISGTNALTHLYCYNNQLTSLDVTALTDLTHFWCYSNQLTSLDVRNNSNLIELSCGDINFQEPLIQVIILLYVFLIVSL